MQLTATRRKVKPMEEKMSELANRLGGKVAVVTGAAQGIGRTYALALAASGAKVCVSDMMLPADTVAEIQRHGGDAFGMVADVTDAASLEAMVAEVRRRYGRLDVLINNAALFGALKMNSFEQIPTAEWDKVITVNVRGTWQTIVAALPLMRESGGGKVLNIASATVFKGTPLMLHYVASKGAIVALTRSIARELSKDGINCNAIAPGLVMSANIQAHPDWAQVAASIVSTRAIKRDSEPADLIGALLFFSSSDSDFITGQTLVVDGGSVMH
jgi:NAD(P)-dependent dehydrogenase (short-subunit alcohol dehydrogenase family)